MGHGPTTYRDRVSVFAVACNLVYAALLAATRRRPRWMFVGPVVAPVLAAAILGWTTRGLFGTAQALGWWGGVYLPLWIVGHHRRWRPVAALVLAVAGWATLGEPHWLEVETFHVPSGEGKLRVALVADLQTDDPGAYEAHALDVVRAAEPDLVLFAGDYVQVADNDTFVRAAGLVAQDLAGLDPPLGAYAVRGDVDADHWELVFAGTPVHVVKESHTFTTRLPDGRPLFVTALSPTDSRSTAPPIPSEPGLHLVVGHAPDYALAAPTADVLFAGHTHGGQVRVPGFGPLVTLSRVPRAWAAGRTVLPGGGTLIVSRGIGMERLDAPQVRFDCRPEVVMVEIGD